MFPWFTYRNCAISIIIATYRCWEAFQLSHEYSLRRFHKITFKPLLSSGMSFPLSDSAKNCLPFPFKPHLTDLNCYLRILTLVLINQRSGWPINHSSIPTHKKDRFSSPNCAKVCGVDPDFCSRRTGVRTIRTNWTEHEGNHYQVEPRLRMRGNISPLFQVPTKCSALLRKGHIYINLWFIWHCTYKLM